MVRGVKVNGEPRGDSKGDHEELSPNILLAGMGELMRESGRERRERQRIPEMWSRADCEKRTRDG